MVFRAEGRPKLGSPNRFSLVITGVGAWIGKCQRCFLTLDWGSFQVDHKVSDPRCRKGKYS